MMETNLDDITAEWARTTADKQLGVEAEKELKTCLEAIKKAVSENKMKVTVYLYAKPACLNELNKRGFKSESHSDQREGDWTTISW